MPPASGCTECAAFTCCAPACTYAPTQPHVLVCLSVVCTPQPHVCITTYDLVRKMQGMEKQYK